MDQISIIEDDEAIAAIERDHLEIDNFQVEIAADGVSGLSRGLSGEFDLILLDLMLPGMDGFSVCRKLREKLNIPIFTRCFGSTGKSEPGTVPAAFPAG